MSLYRSPDNLAREAEARREITKHETCIDSLQSQINNLMRIVYGIEKEKRKHSQAIRQCLSVLSLANRLPTEVLVRIFEHAIFSGWASGPFTVSQVCSAWRDAAKAPALWAQINIDAGRMGSEARINFWYTMLRDSLLDVTFRTSAQFEQTLSALSVIKSKIGKWRSLQVDSHTCFLANLVLAQLTGPASHLTDVTVLVADSSASTELNEENDFTSQQQHRQLVCLDTLKSAPKLKKLTIISDQSSVWTGLPQITSLHLKLSAGEVLPTTRNIVVPDILFVLDASPNLRELSITIPREGVRELVQIELVGQQPHVVPLLSLKTLTLEMDSTIMLILKHFDAPKLQKLDLRCPDASQSYASEEMRSALQLFLDRSQPPLRSFHLYDVDVSQADFLRIFSEFSSIEDIFLHGSDIWDETLLSLASPAFLLPKLRTLDFRWCGHISGEAIEQVVQSRTRPMCSDANISPLQEVSLIACSGVKEKAILNILELCRCRLKVRDEDDVCRELSLSDHHTVRFSALRFPGSRGCCNSTRYRVRFHSRVGAGLSEVQKRNIILV